MDTVRSIKFSTFWKLLVIMERSYPKTSLQISSFLKKTHVGFYGESEQFDAKQTPTPIAKETRVGALQLFWRNLLPCTSICDMITQWLHISIFVE